MDKYLIVLEKTETGFSAYSPERLFEKYYMKPIISKNLTPLPPFPTREWGF